MLRIVVPILAGLILPGAALAEPGSGGDLDRVRRQVEAMQRDGRWQQLIAEGQANKQATEGPRQVPQPVQPPTAGSSSRARARR